MIIKILKYDPVTGRGLYLKPNGATKKFRYTAFAKKAVWAGSLALLKKGKIHKAKWYHRLVWKLRRVKDGNN